MTNKVGDVNNNYLFTGEQFDKAADGYYLRARYYSPKIGRFASTDPFEGFKEQPVTLHNYLYGNINPILYADPSGNLAAIEYAAIGFLAFNTALIVYPLCQVIKGEKIDPVKLFTIPFYIAGLTVLLAYLNVVTAGAVGSTNINNILLIRLIGLFSCFVTR